MLRFFRRKKSQSAEAAKRRLTVMVQPQGLLPDDVDMNRLVAAISQTLETFFASAPEDIETHLIPASSTKPAQLALHVTRPSKER